MVEEDCSGSGLMDNVIRCAFQPKLASLYRVLHESIFITTTYNKTKEWEKG